MKNFVLGDPIVHYVHGELSIQKASSGDWALWRGGALLAMARTLGLIKRHASREHGATLGGWEKRQIDPASPEKPRRESRGVTPWDDCKVCFGVDADADELFAWAEKYAKHFPCGWRFEGTDATGLRMVAVFSVAGLVDRASGEVIRKSLDTLEASKWAP